MKNLKNILVGFFVSFVGSIPLGYLNVIGFQIYKDQGIANTIFYLLGIVTVEFFVIYFTLIFANKLASNQKLIKIIEGFSIFFMFLLAFVFYFNASKNTTYSSEYIYFGFFKIFGSGLILSSLNFIQIPFWTAWNLYLLNGNYIEISKSRKHFYLFGTLLGTFLGMISLILSLSYFVTNVDFLSKYLIKIIIPLVFVGLGFFQAIKFYKKYSH